MGSIKLDTDVAIIGGGIVGIGIFRDLALHKISCQLFDQSDFCSQTSQKTSKMLHGGIRYLQQGDFLLVEEALHEKNLWTHITPHLCYESPFHLLLYKNTPLPPPFIIKMGLFLYDGLSGFENTNHSMLSKNETLKKFPNIKENNLEGAGVYYDAIMDDTKIGLECLYDALLESTPDNSIKAHSYTKLIDFGHHKNYCQLTFKNLLTNEIHQIRARETIFCTGPFTDQVLGKLGSNFEGEKLQLSKGSHIWLKSESCQISHPSVLSKEDGRILFVIPQKNKVLMGTTEVSFGKSDSIQKVTASPEEIKYLIESFNYYFPKSKINENDILSSFAGIRPLVKSSLQDENLGKVTREHSLYSPYENTHVLIGGKYTTFRSMASSLVRILVEKRRLTYFTELTKNPLRKKSVILPFVKPQIDHLNLQNLKEILTKESVSTPEDFIKNRLGIASRKHFEYDYKMNFDDFYNSKDVQSLLKDFFPTATLTFEF
jgi:glycerol-3-phosphate dehydrogenase